jgi:hypothetical protein
VNCACNNWKLDFVMSFCAHWIMNLRCDWNITAIKILLLYSCRGSRREHKDVSYCVKPTMLHLGTWKMRPVQSAHMNVDCTKSWSLNLIISARLNYSRDPIHVYKITLRLDIVFNCWHITCVSSVCTKCVKPIFVNISWNICCHAKLTAAFNSANCNDSKNV